MKTKIDIVEIEGVKYAPVNTYTPNADGLPFVIIRSADSGVTAGYLKRRDGTDVRLVGAFRIWKWAGAFTLFQMASEGVGRPQECKFSVTIDSVEILKVCEVLPCTDKAKENLEAVERCRK